MDEERVKAELARVQGQYQELKEKYGDVSNQPCTLDIGQSKTSLYLSSQQIDLLLLVNTDSVESLRDFVQNCVQLNGYQLGEVTEENLEDKKREVFNTYLDSYIPYTELVPREGFIEKDTVLGKVPDSLNRILPPEYAASAIKILGDSGEQGLVQYLNTLPNGKKYVGDVSNLVSLLRRVQFSLNKNLPQEYGANALKALSDGGEQGLVRYLATLPNGEEYVRNIGRFISLDYENIRGVTYDEIVALDSLMKKDPTITSIVSIAPGYNMAMHYGIDGVKRFDPYFVDRALTYCKMTGKHMRYNSLFSRLIAMSFRDKGMDKAAVMRELSAFSDGFFGYLDTHNETLDDGTRIIDCVQIFSELLCYEPGKPDGKKTGMVWNEYFGMNMEDLFSIIMRNGVSRLPEGVDVMYNETALEEGMPRLKSCDAIIRDVYRVAPGFINVFGQQFHIYDSLFKPENIHMLDESIEFMRTVQDYYGIRVQISEHDLNINGNLVRDCKRFGVPAEYLQLLKRDYQRRLSEAMINGGLAIDTVDYWSIFDKVDHNLKRDIEGRISRGESIEGIDSLHAGLLPEGSDIRQVPSINPEAYERQLNKGNSVVKKLEFPNVESGYASTIAVMVVMAIVLLVLIGICLLVM